MIRRRSARRRRFSTRAHRRQSPLGQLIRGFVGRKRKRFGGGGRSAKRRRVVRSARRVVSGNARATGSYKKLGNGRRMSKILKAISTPNKTNATGVLQLESAAGAQGFVDLVWNTGNPQGAGDALSLYDHLGAFTGQQTIPSYRYMLEKTNMHIQFTNESGAQIVVTVYDLVCKMSQMGNNSQNPARAWPAALLDNGSAYSTGSKEVATTVGSSPYNAPGLMDDWKILRTRRIEMNPGQVHDHNFKQSFNKWVSPELWTGNDANIMLRGITCACLLVVHGYPVNQAGDTQAHRGIITYAPTAVSAIWKYNTQWRWTQDNNVQTVTVLNGVTPINNGTGQTVMNDDAGVPVNATTFG